MNKHQQVLLGIGISLIAIASVACGGSNSAAVPTTAPIAPTTSAPQPTTAPSSANVLVATPEAGALATATAVSNSRAAPGLVQLAAFTKLNLNTVTGEQLLKAIPNFGDRMVREFQEYRPYTSIAQFRREIGKYVDQATVAGYEKYVFVPIDVNQADAATFQQIPGVTTEIAAQLIAARPYESNDDFLMELSALLTPDQVTHAQNYLATQ